MIDIVTLKNERYSYDEDTQRIFKDGVLLPSYMAEPIYSNLDENNIPVFSGILLKNINSILSLSGKINEITDSNTI